MLTYIALSLITGIGSLQPSQGKSLLYPEYSVVVPKPLMPPILLAFPISRHDYDFESFMASWIATMKSSKQIDEMFDYWIEGG